MTVQLKPVTLQSPETDKYFSKSPKFMPYYKYNYKLMYGTQQFYIFFKQFYTIYERIIKAKDLINQKVDEDLVQRNDESLQSRIIELKNERFDIFLGGVLCAMQGSLEANKYEDFARSLLGRRAYLLFAFDKLIISTVKQLLNLANDESCQKSFQIYGKFLNRQEHI